MCARKPWMMFLLFLWAVCAWILVPMKKLYQKSLVANKGIKLEEYIIEDQKLPHRIHTDKIAH